MFTPVYKKEIKELYNHLKGSALKRGIPFNLTVVDLNNLSFPLTCPIFGMPLVFNRNNVEDNSYSVDRIDSSKGYEKDNIVIISQKANRIKTNATLTELKQIISFYELLLEQAEFSVPSR